jgi:CRISPR-associated endonuclease Csn1
VFIPTQVEIENPNLINLGKLNHDQINRIYKIVSFTGNRLYGIQNNISKAIIDKIEFSQLNKMETSLEKISIKEFCWKLSTNRLGIISIKQKV